MTKKYQLYMLLIFVSMRTFLTKNIEARLKFPQYCQYYNYPIQTHVIHTSDGYNLKFFRLQAKNTQITDRNKVVYLQHGLEDSSDTWIVNDEKLAPAFVLAHQGYDIWVGNTRGNVYSSPKLSPRVLNFWDFSFDQMIEYDLPAAFEYINNVTAKKIHYIGHSQGTMMMFGALASRNPVVISFLASFSAFGPVAYVNNQQSALVSSLVQSGFTKLLSSLKVKQLLYTNENTKMITSLACRYDAGLCNLGLLEISEKNNSVNNLQRMPVVMGHFPSGSSLKNLMHFQQLIKSGKFCKFDYGATINMEKYGQKEPPSYRLQDIQETVHIFAGKYDKLADLQDAERLFSELTNSPKKTYKVYDFGHATFIWGKSICHLTDVIQIIEQSQQIL